MADVVGIDQEAGSELTLSSATATNLSDIAVSAVADVDVTVSSYARADAEGAGISQFVEGAYDGYGQVASAMADNQSSIVVSSVATASGTYVGDYFYNSDSGATAFGAGINQEVYDADSLSAT